MLIHKIVLSVIEVASLLVVPRAVTCQETVLVVVVETFPKQ